MSFNAGVTISIITAAIVLATGCRLPWVSRSTPVPSYAAMAEQYQRNDAAQLSFSEDDLEVMAAAEATLKSSMPLPGLPVGNKAPDFTLPNSHGKRVTLYESLEHGPVVLTFYRGAWSPYCRLELEALDQSLPAIRMRNATVLAISPQLTMRSADQLKRDKLGIELLSDVDGRVMESYVLSFDLPDSLHRLYKSRLGLDITTYNGEGRYNLPVPATFVISRDGVIAAAFADTDHAKRMEPEAIIHALDSLPRRPRQSTP